MADNRNAVQFYCDDDEYETLTKAAQLEYRSIASYAKAQTLKAAKQTTSKNSEDQ